MEGIRRHRHIPFPQGQSRGHFPRCQVLVKAMELLAQRQLFFRVQLFTQGLVRKAGAKGGRHLGGEAEKGVGQGLVHPAALKYRRDLLRSLVQDLPLVLGGRRRIGQARQQHPHGAHARPHPPDGVQDASLLVHQDDVGIFSHDFPDEPVGGRIPQFILRLDGDLQHPVHMGLGHGKDPAAGDPPAQQHAKGRGVQGIGPLAAGELGPGMAGVGAQQQAVMVASRPHCQHQLVLFRLMDLFDFAAGQPGDLPAGGKQVQAVHGHGHPSSFVCPPVRPAPPGRRILHKPPADRWCRPKGISDIPGFAGGPPPAPGCPPPAPGPAPRCGPRRYRANNRFC